MSSKEKFQRFSSPTESQMKTEPRAQLAHEVFLPHTFSSEMSLFNSIHSVFEPFTPETSLLTFLMLLKFSQS